MRGTIFAIVCMLAQGAWAQQASRFEVLITELFADPDPSAGLPNSSFIELHNVSSQAISLKGWTIGIGKNSTRITTDIRLGADSLLILCNASAATAYRRYGAVLPLTGLPTLPDGGTILALYAADHRTIHAVEYTLNDYHNALKSGGGWSLEMIDLHQPCLGQENWTASTDPSGGTPGRRNSADRLVASDAPTHALRIWMPDSLHVTVLFDGTLDSISAAIPDRYTIDGGPSIIRAQVQPPLFQQVLLDLDQPLVPGIVTGLRLSGLTDCAGDPVVADPPLRIGLAVDPAPGDLVINEILFDPTPDGADYVELLNQGRSVIDAGGLHLANRDRQGNMGLIFPCAKGPFLIFPGDHYVVTGEPDAGSRSYRGRHPALLSVPVSMPSLPDAEGVLVVTDRQGSVLDELHYDVRWHFPLITDPEGVALERIDPKAVTQDAGNWHSAADDAGHGTPTSRNSQARIMDGLTGIWELTPVVITPDMDGHDDFLTLRYRFPEAGRTCSVTVFDLGGPPVRALCRNLHCGMSGQLQWDGLDDMGRPPGYGSYIVVADVFDLQGHRSTFKKRVSVTGTFR